MPMTHAFPRSEGKKVAYRENAPDLVLKIFWQLIIEKTLETHQGATSGR